MIKEAIEGWADEWFIIADIGADPIIYNLKSGRGEIQQLVHGAGNWDNGEVVADSIGQFILCSAALQHALLAFEEDPILDDGKGFFLDPEASQWFFSYMKI